MSTFRVYDESKATISDENATRIALKGFINDKQHVPKGRVALAEISVHNNKCTKTGLHHQNQESKRIVVPKSDASSDGGYSSSARTESTHVEVRLNEQLLQIPSLTNYTSIHHQHQPSTSSSLYGIVNSSTDTEFVSFTSPKQQGRLVTKQHENQHYDFMSDSGMNMSIDGETSTGTTTFLTARQEEFVKINEDFLYGCADYAESIYAYTLNLSLRYIPSPYLTRQIEVTESMRAILVDWLVDVALEFSMENETFHKAVNYIDRFLSKRSVYKRHLQLVGTAAVMLASKYEEIYPPETQDFVDITDNSYSVSQIRAMERKLLVELDFNISNPSCYHFKNTFAASMSMPGRASMLADYLLVLSSIEYKFVAQPPHLIAAAATALANMMFFREAWPREMSEKYYIKADQLTELIQLLHQEHVNAPLRKDLKAAFDKFAQDRCFNVALVNSLDSLKEIPYNMMLPAELDIEDLSYSEVANRSNVK